MLNKIVIERMKFSIIIPAYKMAFLKDAIDSVVAQAYKDFELIIVDDCSPEDLCSVVRPYQDDARVRYYRNEKNYGSMRLAENWNHCLEYCTGDYVICMGDDDMLTECCLDELAALIEKYPEKSVYHLQTNIVDERGVVTELLEPRYETETVLQMMYYRWAGLGRQQFIGDFCFRLSALRAQGGFYNVPLAWGSDDITAYIAASENGIACTRKVCFLYRKNRLTISNSSNNEEKLRALQLSHGWCDKFLATYKPIDDDDQTTLQLLKELGPVHYRANAGYLVVADLRRSKMLFFSWILKRKRYGLSLGFMISQFVKSFR